MNDFAKKHQIKWGEAKCKVMEIGMHKEKKKEWQLGEKTIGKCSSYKFLGDVISRDRKNTKNLN
jgi:hypothetical protein